ncbi:MAG: PucR family transcriptional regulator, partial [Chloroflexota bacterium]
RLDHDTTLPHAILTVAWDDEEPPTLRRLETSINWLLSSHNRPALQHTYAGDHVVVFQALRDGEDMSSARELDRRLREHIQAEFGDTRLVVGVSGPAKTLAEWPSVHQEALQAMQLAQRLNFNHLVEFNSLGIFQLLSQIEHLAAVQTFTQQIIEPLAEYDRQHRGSLVQTIDAYFNHHANVSQTAESLFIHRNTLLYRLERIQELTGQDINQADMRLALHLALKLWQLRPET